MSLKKLKTSADYDQFYFRIDKDSKEEIEFLLHEILNFKNSKDGFKKIKRNEILIQTLLVNLRKLHKTIKSKS